MNSNIVEIWSSFYASCVPPCTFKGNFASIRRYSSTPLSSIERIHSPTAFCWVYFQKRTCNSGHERIPSLHERVARTSGGEPAHLNLFSKMTARYLKDPSYNSKKTGTNQFPVKSARHYTLITVGQAVRRPGHTMHAQEMRRNYPKPKPILVE